MAAGIRHGSHHVAAVAESEDGNVDVEEIAEIGTHEASRQEEASTPFE